MFCSRLIVVLVVAVGGAGVFVASSADAATWGDFDDIVQKYAQKLGKEYGREVLWADAFYRRPHLQENANYEKYQASADVIGDVHYGQPASNVSRPAWIFKQWFHNSMSSPMISKFSSVKVVSDEFTWNVDANFKYAKEGKTKKNFTFIIPPQLGLERKNYSKKFDADEVMKGVRYEESTVKYDSFNISQDITVPPNSSVLSTLTITGNEVTIPWSAELEISGYFAIWFKRRHNAHYLWFYPVWHLLNESPHFRRHESSLRYTIKGTFKGVYSKSAHLHLQEYPLRQRKLMPLKMPKERMSKDYEFHH